MPSVIYDSALESLARGAINFDADAFKVMLVNGYEPDKNNHRSRGDITDEIIGTGYGAGGNGVAVSVIQSPDRIEITLGGAEWSGSTITAHGAVYYRSRGASASADELIAFIDFGGDVISTNGTFALTSSALRIQN